MDSSREPTAISDLVGTIVAQTRELVAAEVALGKKEAVAELGQLRTSAVAAASAIFAVVVAVLMALVAISLITPAPGLTAGIFAGLFTAIALAAAVRAKKAMPTNLLGETQQRMKRDLHQIEERGAWLTAPTKNP